MAMKKKTEPKPPTPRQSAMTSTKSPAKKSPSASAGAMGKKVAAKGSKVTSAATRDKMAKQPSMVQGKRMTAQADAYKKSGASYLGKGISSYYDIMKSPSARSERNDLSGSGRAKFDPYGFVSFTGGRTSQRAKDQEKRKKK